MNWKDRALQAAQEKTAQEEEAKRQRDAAERQKQIVAFGRALAGLLGEEVAVEDLEVEVDGTRFKWTRHQGGHGITILGPCPGCGAWDWSDPINDLARLGTLLQDFRPRIEHTHDYARLLTDTPRTIPTR